MKHVGESMHPSVTFVSNNNRAGYRLARSVLDGKYPWLEDGIVQWEPLAK